MNIAISIPRCLVPGLAFTTLMFALRDIFPGNQTCNLSNGTGLPASPFRTDDEPATTRDADF